VAALQRAVALAEMDAVAIGIEQDLDLDVTRALEEPLEDEAVIAERRVGLPSGGRELGRQIRAIPHGPHALAPATGRRLDEDRVADPLRGPLQGRVTLVRAVVALDGRDPETARELPRGRLVAHRPDRRRGRSDPADPGREDGLGEGGVLGEEPESRVDGVCVRGHGGRHDRCDVEEVERGRPVGRWDDGDDPESIARPGDPGGDLAAVGDEHTADRLLVRRGRRLRRGNRRWRGRRSGRGHERVQRARRDTPSPADAPSGQTPRRDPALDGARRRPDARCRLARAQFLGHVWRDCRDPWTGRQARHAARWR
jgi:hypothetical protein